MWQFLIGTAIGYLAGKSNRDDSGALKPVAKIALKAGIKVFEKGMEAAAHLKESAEDLFAEAQADMDAQAAAERTRQDQESEPHFREPVPRRRSPRKRTRMKRPDSEKPEAHAATSEH